MADKSAFVPVEAVTDRKNSAEVEADIDAELFGKKASETKVQLEMCMHPQELLVAFIKYPALIQRATNRACFLGIRTSSKVSCDISLMIQQRQPTAHTQTILHSGAFLSRMAAAVEEGKNDVAAQNATSFQRIVRMTMVIKRWIKLKKEEERKKEGNVDDDNVRLVFGYASHSSAVAVKEKWQQKVLYWSLDDTSLTFYLWTAVVFIGCFYNLITIVAM
ncbi:hypothetical protein OSTOST_10701, partial [Ostertagia ostertagi]